MGQNMPNYVEIIPDRRDMLPYLPEPNSRIGKLDLAVIAIITFVFSILAFCSLGDIKSPQTTWYANDGQYVVFELADETEVKTTAFMLGARNNKSFTLSVSSDNQNWQDIMDVKGNAVFRWQMEATAFTGRYVRITSLDDDLYIQELGFLDAEGVPVTKSVYEHSFYHTSNWLFGQHPAFPAHIYANPPLISNNPEFLLDEQDLIPARATFLNGTYFDEIYHARTAYEFIHSLEVYEWSHPPLGKAIISSGILLFGMSPFGWRFAGTLFGVLMLPVMYIFAKKVFHSLGWAFFATFLFAADFMRFTQTRIATLDVFVTFFIMVMFLFMYLYYSLNFFNATKRGKDKHYAFIRSLVYLLCCGIFSGLAMAVKWQGIFAMLGIPVLVSYTLHKRHLEYKSFRVEDSYNNDQNTKYFKRYMLITLICCILFLVAAPVVIYSLSYIPYLRTPSKDGIDSIIDNQVKMFNYHSRLESTHPYSSQWFTWPFMLRPILYYSWHSYDGISTSIAAFGNPAVWWVGVVALVYCARSILKRFNSIVFFLFVAFASLYLPWIFVGRTTFIYHYFPCVPFVILMITYMFKHWAVQRKPKVIAIYLSLTLALLIVFYPVISGHPTQKWYVDTFLRWSPTWSLRYTGDS